MSEEVFPLSEPDKAPSEEVFALSGSNFTISEKVFALSEPDFVMSGSDIAVSGEVFASKLFCQVFCRCNRLLAGEVFADVGGGFAFNHFALLEKRDKFGGFGVVFL
jgi:hypothetical protein